MRHTVEELEAAQRDGLDPDDSELLASWREWVAYHEAGHAVVSWALGFPLESVTLSPDGKSESVCHNAVPMEWLQERYGTDLELGLRVATAFVVAGKLAQDLFTGRRESWSQTGLRGDRNSLEKGAAAMELLGLGNLWDGPLQEIEAATAKLLRDHWTGLEALARALLERGTLSGPEVWRVLASGIFPPFLRRTPTDAAGA